MLTEQRTEEVLLSSFSMSTGMEEITHVERAVEEFKTGNSLAVSKLEHRLSGDDDEDVILLLDELNRVCVGDWYEDVALERIVSHVLGLGFERIARSKRLCEVYTKLLLNLASSNAVFVEPCLLVLCRGMQLGDDVECVRHSVLRGLAHILDQHPAALRPFAAMLTKNFPHHRNPVEKICAYSSFLLVLCEQTSSRFLREHIIGLEVERIAVVDAEAASITGEVDQQLTEKLDAMLALFLEFVRKSAESQPQTNNELFRIIYSAFERTVLPTYRLSAAPFILFFSCACAPAFFEEVDDHLRTIFFDSAVPTATRSAALQHSAALVGHLSLVSVSQVLVWQRKIAGFMHRYLDSCDPASQVIDVDVHNLFYTAFGCMMTTIVTRRNSLAAYPDGDEQLRQLRLARLVRSSLNPLKLMPSEYASEFGSVLCQCGVADVTDVLIQNEGVPIPTKTKWGNRNSIELVLPLAHFKWELEQCARFVNPYWVDERAPSMNGDPVAKGSCDGGRDGAMEFATSVCEPIGLAR